MAYYSYYDPDFGEHDQIPYASSYSVVSSAEALPSSSGYGYVDHGYFHYGPASYYYNPAVSLSTVAYSASALTEPHNVVYDPNSFGISHSPEFNRFQISYSVSEFNEPDFDEYDPTPYGGGYDLHATYGKPLSPSEEICYPPSSFDPGPLSLENIPVGSVGSPYEKEGADDGYAAEPEKESEPTQADKDKEEHPQVKNEEEKNSGLEGSDDHHSQSGHGNELQNGKVNGNLGDDYNEKIEVVPQMPSGYGLEAMDLCETIFGGYFPCLSHSKRLDNHNRQEAPYREVTFLDPWKETSDYLFGNPNPYNGDGRSYGESVYCYYPYQRQYQEQPLYQFQLVQHQEDDSWQHN